MDLSIIGISIISVTGRVGHRPPLSIRARGRDHWPRAVFARFLATRGFFSGLIRARLRDCADAAG